MFAVFSTVRPLGLEHWSCPKSTCRVYNGNQEAHKVQQVCLVPSPACPLSRSESLYLGYTRFVGHRTRHLTIHAHILCSLITNEHCQVVLEKTGQPDPDVYAIGDAAMIENTPLPATAQGTSHDRAIRQFMCVVR